MASNRERALSAAIELLANDGIRAVTHLRVDQQAGIPRGSTSNVFRTREALLVGVCEAMVSSEIGEVEVAFHTATSVDLIHSLVDLFNFLTGPNRQLTAARLALLVEAGHDNEVRAALSKGRATMEESIRPAFVALGAPDPDLAVQLIAACFEGLFLHVLGRRLSVDPEPVIAAIVRAGLSGNQQETS